MFSKSAGSFGVPQDDKRRTIAHRKIEYPPMLTFHAVGDWNRDQVFLSQMPCTRSIVPEVERIIDETWQRITSQPGVHLFDGPMCRLESWSAAPARLDIAMSGTSYKPFIGTNLYHPELADRYGPSILANPIGVSPALETADGWLMMGRRNGSVAYYPNRVHPFAGALEPRDANDLFGAVLRELAEELAFTNDDIAEIRCTGVVEDWSIRQMELVFRVVSTRTRSQVEATLDGAEHDASWAVQASAQAIDAALNDPLELTPVAVAALLLWGNARFGSDWFKDRTDRMKRVGSASADGTLTAGTSSVS